MPNQWPAHLMFLSLLWQFGGEPYAEDGSAATYDDEAGVQALGWMREQVEKGYSPDNVDIDTQYVAFKNGENSITWDGIWQINDLKESGLDYGIATRPGDRGQPGRLGQLAQLLHDRAGGRRRGPGERREDLHRLDVGAVRALGRRRHDPRPQLRPRGAGVHRLGAGRAPDQVEALHFLPPVPGLGDVQIPDARARRHEAMLGQTPAEDALGAAADKATELMQRTSRSSAADVTDASAQAPAARPRPGIGERPGARGATTGRCAVALPRAVPGALPRLRARARSVSGSGSACTATTSPCPASRSSASTTTPTSSTAGSLPRGPSGTPCRRPGSSRCPACRC